MDTRKQRHFPADLERAQRRFARWRQTRQGRSRIPDTLWALAVTLAQTHGIARTSGTLRLDYYSLKRRVEQQAAGSSSSAGVGGATFVELTPAVSASSECLVELEDDSGVKMRVHLKGIEAPDLVALSRSLWGVES